MAIVIFTNSKCPAWRVKYEVCSMFKYCLSNNVKIWFENIVDFLGRKFFSLNKLIKNQSTWLLYCESFYNIWPSVDEFFIEISDEMRIIQDNFGNECSSLKVSPPLELHHIPLGYYNASAMPETLLQTSWKMKKCIWVSWECHRFSACIYMYLYWYLFLFLMLNFTKCLGSLYVPVKSSTCMWWHSYYHFVLSMLLLNKPLDRERLKSSFRKLVCGDFIKQYDNMKFPSHECCMTFWSMTIRSDILHLSDIMLTRDRVTKVDIITECDYFT